MRRILLLLILSCFSGFLSGCATSGTSAFGGACYNKTLPMLLDSTDLKALFQDIASDFCVDTCPGCSGQTDAVKDTLQTCSDRDGINPITLLVTDFADIQSFLPNQSGLLMGELMRGSLNKICCYKIVQAEFAKYFKLTENGLVVLTRKVNEIKKDEYFQSEVIVGTYSYLNNNKVIIFVRKIDTKTGKISRMVTREINYTCEGRAVMGYAVR
ncbi:MAG: FlgO family outer membrane protein [Desulfuromonadaceae bacterium]|nr:FlgO family outer membrane protein [Desulfuromonadaceae bacterium]